MIREILNQGRDFGIYGAYGAGCGFIYGKLAHLPAGSIAKAWAIWNVVSFALQEVAASFSANQTHKIFIKLGVGALVDGVGIYELRKRGLMGDKMMCFIIINNIAATLLYATGGINVLIDYYNAQLPDDRYHFSHPI